jgi:hypothetical protein
MMRFVAAWLFSLLISGTAGAQSSDGLTEFRWLIGDWRGVGQGDPGTSGSERRNDSFLDGRYIRVTGTSVYPQQEKNPKGEVHEQLDLWSYDRARSSVVLRTFDTLGFTCTYVLDKSASSADRWVLNAESLENVPKGMKARYIYTRPSENAYHEVLELDTDGKGFKPYVTNRFLKVEPPRS